MDLDYRSLEVRIFAHLLQTEEGQALVAEAYQGFERRYGADIRTARRLVNGPPALEPLTPAQLEIKHDPIKRPGGYHQDYKSSRRRIKQPKTSRRSYKR